jgi:O-acetyl-ADP-ribose deacetylase (regulator of RNase III)
MSSDVPPSRGENKRKAAAEAGEPDAEADAADATASPTPPPAPPAELTLNEPWRGVTPRRVDRLPGGALLVCSQGSVVAFRGGALVNAANTGCLGGGGVDGAVNDVGGPVLEDARYALPVVQPPRTRCPTGDAKVTVAGNLHADWVIHAVGPDFRAYDDDAEADALLTSAYAAAMRAAQQKGVQTLAFSLISAAIFRGHRTLSDVLGTAVRTIRAHAYDSLREVHMVAFTPLELRALLAAAAAAAEAEVPASADALQPPAAGGAAEPGHATGEAPSGAAAAAEAAKPDASAADAALGA